MPLGLLARTAGKPTTCRFPPVPRAEPRQTGVQARLGAVSPRVYTAFSLRLVLSPVLLCALPSVLQYALWEMVQDEWLGLEADYCRALVESMPRRMKAVIKAKGGHTKY